MRSAGCGGGFAGGGIIALILAALYFGIDPTPLLQGLEQQKQPGLQPPRDQGRTMNWPMWCWRTPKQPGAKNLPTRAASTRNRCWWLFTDSVNTACGLGQSAMGPFYCPGDRRISWFYAIYAIVLRRRGISRSYGRARSRASRAKPARRFWGQVRREILGALARPPATRRCGWSCRPTVWPASGAITPASCAICSKTVTLKKA